MDLVAHSWKSLVSTLFVSSPFPASLPLPQLLESPPKWSFGETQMETKGHEGHL